ncbi:MAG TPA: SRPBCC family protein [Actinomycetes bacterium]|nr:SRPBCC family protein [Actinomycetes bacterium]
MRARVEERVAVAVPPRVLWEAVVDWRRQGEWVPLTTVRVEPGGHRVGERLSAATGIGPLRFEDPMEVTRWDPPQRVDVRHLGTVVRGTGTFTVEPAPGGAWFTWVEELDLPLGRLGRLGFSLVGPVVSYALRRGLRRLARQVEAGGRPGA